MCATTVGGFGVAGAAVAPGVRPARRMRVLRASSAGGRRVAVTAERTFVMVKPDGVQRGLAGEVLGRFEAKGFHCKAAKLYACPRSVAEEHYKDLSSKPFYGALVDYIVSGPVFCMVSVQSCWGRVSASVGVRGARAG